MQSDQDNLNQQNRSWNFLLKEYDQCFNQMRHYDNVSVSMIKFAFSIYSALGTIAFAIYQFLYRNENSLNVIIGSIALFTFLVGFIIVLMLTRNRLYFVSVAKQVNRIRNLSIYKSKSVFDFKSALPYDPNIPKAFNIRSIYLITIFLLCFMNSVAIFTAFIFLLTQVSHWLLMFLSFLLLAFQIVCVVLVLNRSVGKCNDSFKEVSSNE
jgi:hypothetical protein